MLSSCNHPLKVLPSNTRLKLFTCSFSPWRLMFVFNATWFSASALAISGRSTATRFATSRALNGCTSMSPWITGDSKNRVMFIFARVSVPNADNCSCFNVTRWSSIETSISDLISIFSCCGINSLASAKMVNTKSYRLNSVSSLLKVSCVLIFKRVSITGWLFSMRAPNFTSTGSSNVIAVVVRFNSETVALVLLLRSS